MEQKITIKARLLNKAGEPIANDGTIMKLFDKDILDDDFLGQSKVDGQGEAAISFVPSDFSSKDSPGERKPDIYIAVFKYGKLLYQSAVLHNFDIDRHFILNPEYGQTIDLGALVIS